MIIEDKCKVTFFSEEMIIDEKIVSVGELVTPPKDLFKEDHEISYWYTDNRFLYCDIWEFNTPVTGDINLYVRWIESGYEEKRANQLFENN